VLDVRVLAAAASGSPRTDGTFVLAPPLGPKVVDGPLYYLRLPLRLARELRRFEPDVVVAQSPYEAGAALLARRLARSGAAILLDVHGDWRTFTRLYGSSARRALSPLADRLATAALRRADGVRTVTAYTTGLAREVGVEPVAEFPAYMDLELFRARPPAPLPGTPTALFVGVLERYKNVDRLVRVWPRVAAAVPGARLRLVGDGELRPLVEALLRDEPGSVRWDRSLAPEEVAAALDDASLLVLPSRSEGMGRVLVEAFCRARPVLGAAVGGIRDLVEDGRNGVLVDPDDEAGLEQALRRLLGDPDLVERLAAGAGESADRWIVSPEEFARRQADAVERVLAR
jgi:glycosyltransferase involved in cell wall biosynthesis